MLTLKVDVFGLIERYKSVSEQGVSVSRTSGVSGGTKMVSVLPNHPSPALEVLIVFYES